MQCNEENTMSDIWAIIVVVILVLIVYGIVSAKLEARKRRLAQERMLPSLREAFVSEASYDLSLSDGRTFKSVLLLGTTDSHVASSPLGEWGVMLVLLQPSGKKAFVRPYSVRCIEES